jgi:hypothetical protein
MNLFRRFRKQPQNELFSFNFFISEETETAPSKINLHFKSRRGQEELIAEFIFRIRNDEELWAILFEQITKDMTVKEIQELKDHIGIRYKKYIDSINAAVAAVNNSDRPLISPLVKKGG